METFVQQFKNIPHDKLDNQLIDLKLIDGTTNVEYVLKVQKEVYNRATNGKMAIINIIFNDVKNESYYDYFLGYINITIIVLLFTDTIFATTLLEKVKMMDSSKNIHNSPISMIVNDINNVASSSCSNINMAVSNDSMENILSDNTSNTVNTSDTSDTDIGKFNNNNSIKINKV